MCNCMYASVNLSTGPQLLTWLPHRCECIFVHHIRTYNSSNWAQKGLCHVPALLCLALATGYLSGVSVDIIFSSCPSLPCIGCLLWPSTRRGPSAGIELLEQALQAQSFSFSVEMSPQWVFPADHSLARRGYPRSRQWQTSTWWVEKTQQRQF